MTKEKLEEMKARINKAKRVVDDIEKLTHILSELRVLSNFHRITLDVANGALITVWAKSPTHEFDLTTIVRNKIHTAVVAVLEEELALLHKELESV
jgi:hypothetical protein